MTFEEWMSTDPTIFVPDDEKSAQKSIEIAMKVAFEAGRVSALDEITAAIRVIREPYT